MANGIDKMTIHAIEGMSDEVLKGKPVAST